MTISGGDFDELFRRLYRQLQDETVDPEAAFDLACAVLSVEPFAADATELARLCLEGGSGSGIAAAARAFLSGRFVPGFAEEPGWLATLEEALEVVNRDMRTCGLPGTGHLHVRDGGTHDEYAFVEVWHRYNSHGTGCRPQSGSDPVSALVTVADDAQDAVMHAICGVWPVCPDHGLGTHADERDGMAVWWCGGSGGHSAAPIGQWPG